MWLCPLLSWGYWWREISRILMQSHWKPFRLRKNDASYTESYQNLHTLKCKLFHLFSWMLRVPHTNFHFYMFKKMPPSGNPPMDCISGGRVLRRAFIFSPCTDKLNRRHPALPAFHLRRNLIRLSSGFDQRGSSESLTGQNEIDCQTETSVPKVEH